MQSYFQYFFVEGEDLPEGIGFGHFTPAHFAQLAVCALFCFFLCFWFVKKDFRGQTKFLRILAVCMLLGNLARDIFLLCIGRMSLAFLPLHLCSFSIFVYLLHAFLPESQDPAAGKVIQSTFREYLGETGFVLLLPGTVSALIFPDWTDYPVFCFMNLHSFLWHTVLCAYPIMLYITHRIRPCIRHIWFPVCFLLVITPPIYAFDRAFDLNYLFVNWPLAGTPLETLYDLMGKYWRVGYAVLVFLVILCVYLIIGLLRVLVHALHR